jgi:hypothetical protein
MLVETLVVTQEETPAKTLAGVLNEALTETPASARGKAASRRALMTAVVILVIPAMLEIVVVVVMGKPTVTGRRLDPLSTVTVQARHTEPADVTAKD